jgi:GntR family transcriptional repressor for pyruvate dehydrogenase complex
MSSTELPNALSKIVVAQPEPMASEVLKRLLDYLFSGEVQPGDRIPSERQLTESLGVNRPAVREAIRTLAFLGLLDVRQSSGTYFRDPDQDLMFTLFELSLTFGERRLRSLVEARGELEVLVAGLAAERRSDDDVAALRELLRVMSRTTGTEFVEADMAFHARVASAAQNDVLQDMLKGVQAMVREWVGRNVGAAKTTKVMYNDHVPIFMAIEAGDVAGAKQAMAEHMAGARNRLAPQFFTRGRAARALRGDA